MPARFDNEEVRRVPSEAVRRARAVRTWVAASWLSEEEKGVGVRFEVM
jgi:hypothetical protein